MGACGRWVGLGRGRQHLPTVSDHRGVPGGPHSSSWSGTQVLQLGLVTHDSNVGPRHAACHRWSLH